MTETFSGTTSIPLVTGITEGDPPWAIAIEKPMDIFELDVIFTAAQTSPNVPAKLHGLPEDNEPGEDATYEVERVWLEGHEDTDDRDRNYCPNDFEQWLIEYLQDEWDLLNDAWNESNMRDAQ